MDKYIRYFFEAYFHLDWSLEFGTSTDAVKSFCDNEPLDNKVGLMLGLEKVLHESRGFTLCRDYEANFRPELEGYTDDQWIQMVLDSIKGSIQGGLPR